MTAYLTTRSRIATFSGTWGGNSFLDLAPPALGQGAGFTTTVTLLGSLPDVQFILINTQSSSGSGEQFAGPPGLGMVILELQLGPGWSGTITPTSTPVLIDHGGGEFMGNPGSCGYSGMGAWNISIGSMSNQVAEYVNAGVDSARSDANGFPNYGGASTADQPFNYQIQLGEYIPAGTPVSISATYDAPAGFYTDTHGAMVADPVSLAVSIVGTFNTDVAMDYVLSLFTRAVATPTEEIIPPTFTSGQWPVGYQITCQSNVAIDPAVNVWGVPFTGALQDNLVATGIPPPISTGSYNFNGGTVQAVATWTKRQINMVPPWGPRGIVISSTWIECAAQYQPAQGWAINGVMQTPVGNYLDKIGVHVDGATSSLAQPVYSVGGAFSASDIQRYGQAGATLFWYSGAASSTPTASYIQNSFGPIDCYVPRGELVRLKEDPLNWRMLFRGWQWPALGLGQAASTSPDATPSTTNWSGTNATLSDVGPTLSADIGTSSPSGALTRGWGNAATAWLGTTFKAYRYLRIYVACTDTSSGDHLDATAFAITLPGVGTGNVSKVWDTKTDDAKGYVEIDLCIPITTAGSDATDSMYPLTADPPRAGVDGPFTGVTNVVTMVLSGLPQNTTWVISSVQLVRHNYTKATMLCPFNWWIDSHEEDMDGATPAQYRVALTGETDGRLSMERFDSIRLSDGMGGWNYVPPTIAQLVSGVTGDEAANQYEGWTGTTPSNPPGTHCGDPIPPLSCLLQNGNWEACMLAGGGLLYTHGTRGYQWSRTVEQDITSSGSTLQAQLLFDSIRLYPGCGDVFGFLPSPDTFKYGVTTPLACGKINLRGVSWGILVRDPLDMGQYGASLVDVTLMPNEADGSGICDIPNGLYQTGGSGARGLDNTTTTALYTPPSVVSRKFFGGKRHRAALRARGQNYKVLDTSSKRSWLHVGVGNVINTHNLYDYSPALMGQPVGTVDQWISLRGDERRGVLVAIGTKAPVMPATDPTITSWYSTDCGVTLTETGSMVAKTAVLERDSESGLFIVLYSDASYLVWTQQSTDGGKTWGTPVPATLPISDGGTQLNGLTIDLTTDPRRGALLLSLGNPGGTSTTIYGSTDKGLTWRVALS